MLDRPIRTGWISLLVLAPLVALAVNSEGAAGKLVFCTIAATWAWTTIVPRETELIKWLPVLSLVLGIVCGASGQILPWVGPVLCMIAIGGALFSFGLQPAIRWLIVSCALAAALIRASGGDFGPDPFSNWLASLGFSPEMAWNVTVFLRKSVHFVFFGLIGWTAFRGIRLLDERMQWWWPLGWALLNATLDETRQHFAVGRTGSAVDVVLDVAGSATFIALAWARRANSPKCPAADAKERP